MGSFALLWFGIAVFAFFAWGVGMIVIGAIYDVYLLVKYICKGIGWLWRKLKH